MDKTEVLTGGFSGSMGENPFEEMLSEMSNEFINHMVPFWMRMSDMEYGGYYGLFTNDLELDKRADKGCILNRRIL